MSEPRQPVVALVGCGNWGKHILRDLRSLGCAVPVAARSPESRDRAAAGGAARIVAEVDELGSIDGAVIATPTNLHTKTIDQLLPLGVPIFCEKPLTPVLADAERLLRTAADRVFVMDKWRYHPGVLGLAGIARSGELGRVIGIQTTRVQWGNPHPDTANTVWHLMPHDLSIAIEILGHLPPPIAAIADCVHGEVMGMNATLADSQWVAVTISARSQPNRREVRMFAEGGVAWFGDSYDTSIHVADLPRLRGPLPEPRLVEVGSAMPLLEELRTFVQHLSGGPPPRSSLADAVVSVRAITRLHELAGVDP